MTFFLLASLLGGVTYALPQLPSLPIALPSLAANPPRYLFSFGDSYSATGFDVNGLKPNQVNPIGNPVYPGSTTAGTGKANWVGHLVHDDSPRNTLSYNFAVSGATTNNSKVNGNVADFITQVSTFSGSVGTTPHPSYAPWTSSNSAFAIWFGINDIGNSYAQNNTHNLNTQILEDYFKQVDILYNAGGRRFLFIQIPPMNRTPNFIAAGTTAARQDGDDGADYNMQLVMQAMEFQMHYNGNITQMAATWEQGKGAAAGSMIQTMTTDNIFNPILDNPKLYGAPNNTCHNYDGTSCLWWDGYHPGQAIQTAVGKAVFRALMSEGFYT